MKICFVDKINRSIYFCIFDITSMLFINVMKVSNHEYSVIRCCLVGNTINSGCKKVIKFETDAMWIKCA